MYNERGAGRKAIIDKEQMPIVIDRINSGESVSNIALEFGISRQALYKRIKAYSVPRALTLDYCNDGKKDAEIVIDVEKKEARIKPTVNRLLTYQFGIKPVLDWRETTHFLEKEYFESRGIDSEELSPVYLCSEVRHNSFSISDILSKNGHIRLSENSLETDTNFVPSFEFCKKDLMLARTDTDGYQYKALSYNRKWFVKAQAVMGMVYMNDWAVEIIASFIGDQLGIPCVAQKECFFVYADRKFYGVYSANFELQGLSFVSFESLILKRGYSTEDSFFIRMSTIDKLEWCALQLAEIGNLPFEDTLKYMISMALIDCLVGNVDRHTRNYGLFYDSYSGEYRIPLVFDNGMGLFEHDYYRDRYDNYESAMRNVYVSPYGEDPFDMIKILADNYDLTSMFMGICSLDYGEKTLSREWSFLTDNARIYVKKMKECIQKICQKKDY